MIITLAGAPASGKGTVGKLLAKKLGFPAYSTGQMRRDEAQKRNLTIEEFNDWSEKNPEGDKIFDDRMEMMGKTQDNFVIDARLGWYFIPQSIKVFLDVELNEGAKRRFAEINKPGRAEEHQTTLAQVKKILSDRTKHDLVRYGALYGIKEYDKTKFDIVIDTTEMTPQQVVDGILGSIKKMEVENPKESN